MHKNTYADMDCDYCLFCKQCEYGICPHILEALEDLTSDKAFINAVATAEVCDNRHKITLLMLKDKFAKEVNNG